MSKNTPFFNNFIEAETLTEEEINQVSGGVVNRGNFSNIIFPLDSESETATRKSPSDDDEGISAIAFEFESPGIVFPDC
ncbi:microviridin/marinostatin family tricyclic proteinase inhibitor [Vibrio sp. S9_S30]|uniref:microviridin/marinostatin family tricyclic proteinase inhibitor n=1 Tax=Vibrio sp. S9_S30 TaxID=2720226 RepID=UPI0016812270|nr:microviridin/marinostatin family tricyclic proteinase inhibitor [Vibrio sp. S9_S30]MBD1556374.1 microviridin/marinostatin family tricyclic proteinase inhibitor [Vibrio sp. S9_S30]